MSLCGKDFLEKGDFSSVFEIFGNLKKSLRRGKEQERLSGGSDVSLFRSPSIQLSRTMKAIGHQGPGPVLLTIQAPAPSQPMAGSHSDAV